jgi:hypothetical protein
MTADFYRVRSPPHLIFGTANIFCADPLGRRIADDPETQATALLDGLAGSLAKAEREGTLRERLRFLCRPQLLIIDEIGYLP